MSEAAKISASLVLDERLGIGDLRVFAAIASSAGDSLRCSPSREELRTLSGVKRVSRHTKNLERCGYIKMEKVKGGSGRIYSLVNDAMKSDGRRIPNLQEFGREYLEYEQGVHTASTVRTNKTALREFERFIGADRPLHSIGTREIEQFLSRKKQDASEWTARKYYAALRSAFEKAVQWEYLQENPFRKVQKPKVSEIEPAYFTANDFRLLLSVIQDRDFRDLCIVAFFTGARLGELLALHWEDIDFASQAISVRNTATFTTKTRKNRKIPMSDAICQILQQRKAGLRNESSFVLSSQDGKSYLQGTVSQKFKRAIRKAGLDDRLHFHSLRHSFASALVGSGASLYGVQKVLGHASSKTTERYSHLLPQQLQNEVNAISKDFSIPECRAN